MDSSLLVLTTVSTNKKSDTRLVLVLRWVKVPPTCRWNLLESPAPLCLAPLHSSVVCEEFLPGFFLSLTVCSVDYTAPLYHFSSVSYDFPSECVRSRCWLTHLPHRQEGLLWLLDISYRGWTLHFLFSLRPEQQRGVKMEKHFFEKKEGCTMFWWDTNYSQLSS